jgi:isoquinoline 1-oxidoreductase beta subunit
MRVDMLDKVTGAPIFGIDVALPDMLYGTVRMSPCSARSRSGRPVEAEKMPGVVKIVPLDTSYGSGFWRHRQNTWAAFKAAEADRGRMGQAAYPADSAADHESDSRRGGQGDATHDRDDGDVDAAFADAPADKVIEADYTAFPTWRMRQWSR